MKSANERRFGLKTKAVYIKWIDSAFISEGWVRHPDVPDTKPMMIESVGIVYKETKKYICLSVSVTTACVAGMISIPKSCIKKIVRLKID